MAVLTRKDTKVALIKKVPLFAPLAKAQLMQVASIADELTCRRGRFSLARASAAESSSFCSTARQRSDATAGSGRLLGLVSSSVR